MNNSRTDLSKDELPKKWYNILPDLPEPLPGYKDKNNGNELRNLPQGYTKTASNLEFSDKRWIDIPEEVVNAYIHCNRPRPLIRAYRLEEFLKTSARIYYKCENLPPGGTFKTNTALPQAYWAMKEGYERTVFAGATTTRTKFIHVFAAQHFNLKPILIMTRTECERDREQAFFLRKMFNTDLLASPSNRTNAGRKYLEENPNHPGSNDTVGAEVREISNGDEAKAVVSSFLNHVLMTQTITGLEVKKQLEQIDETPNLLIAPVGGGSSLFGLISPFVGDYLQKKIDDIRFLAIEPEISAKLTNGTYEYVSMHDTASPMANILGKAYDLGKTVAQKTIKGKGIQVKTAAPLLSFLRHKNILETKVYPNDEQDILEAAQIFLQTEGRLIAPESAYAIRAAIDEARTANKSGKSPVIVVSISGTAFLDFGEKKGYTDLG